MGLTWGRQAPSPTVRKDCVSVSCTTYQRVCHLFHYSGFPFLPASQGLLCSYFSVLFPVRIGPGWVGRPMGTGVLFYSSCFQLIRWVSVA